MFTHEYVMDMSPLSARYSTTNQFTTNQPTKLPPQTK